MEDMCYERLPITSLPCVFITAGPIIKLCAGGECVYVCMFITAVPISKLLLLQYQYFCMQCVCFYYCSTYYKAVREGGGGEWRTCATRDYEPRQMPHALCANLESIPTRWGPVRNPVL